MVYFVLLLLHEGLRLSAHPDLLLWTGFFWVTMGGIMIAFASVRSHHRLWFVIFKDIGARGSPLARFVMGAAGWALVLFPFLLLFYMAYIRLLNFDLSKLQ